MSMKNFSDSIGNPSRDLSVCSAVPQPLRHRVPPIQVVSFEKKKKMLVLFRFMVDKM
jgi:hypothetical protein